MISIEDLYYIPLFALLFIFWYFGSQILSEEKDLSIKSMEEEDKDPLSQISIDTKLGDEEVHLELNKLKGKRIEKVFYTNLNYPFYEFRNFDSVDYAVTIQFEGNQFLNWLFYEGSYDLEKEKNKHSGYYLDFSNQLNNLTNLKYFYEVSKDRKWKKILSKKIHKFDLSRIPSEGDNVCEKLIIETDSNEKFGFFSTDEPKRLKDNTLQVNLEFDIEWTTVVFDRDLLK